MKPINLILAERDDRVRECIARKLAESRRIVLVEAVDNYYELLYLISDHGCGFCPDIVLMDLEMPDSKRFPAESVRVHFYKTRLLLMSLQPTKASTQLAQAYGAVRLLDKDDIHSFIPAIELCVGPVN